MRAPTWLSVRLARAPGAAGRLWRTAADRATGAASTAGRLWRTAADRATGAASTARHVWRRSLQLRIVTITLLSSSLLVGGFGLLVASRSADILLSRAEDDVSARLHTKVEYATGQLGVHRQVFDAKLPITMNDTVAYLGEGDTEQPGGSIVTLRSERYRSLKPVTQPAIDTSALISPQLVAAVAAEGQVAQQIRTADVGGGRQKYLVYGSPVPTGFGQLELYYIVPLSTEDRAANQIRATVLGTGLALVVLLGFLAALVTRLVVNPVRVAARTAQRLSAGLLDQRMKVDGEDDLARLAASFNQMAANLQRQIVRLEEMSRLQRRFTSDVSHELRTPLTTVRMAADLIFAEREEFDPAVARSAELLQAELDRFESLLTDLLEISRFDAGFAMLDAEPTDLVPVVRRVVDRLAGVGERAGVRIDVVVPDAEVIAEVDPRRMERILRNLVGNAVEHGEGRPVLVRMACDDEAVAVTVRDHGVGLKPGYDELVFNRFWRADPSRARQTGGTGLGLSISLEDARLHGGWLQAWGAPGAGAQFRLTLPVRLGGRLAASPLPMVPDDLPAEPATSESESTAAPDEVAPDEVASDGVVSDGVVSDGGAGGGEAGGPAAGGGADGAGDGRPVGAEVAR